MTDQRFEQLLHEVLDAETPTRAPERLVPETQRAVRRVRRQPTWLATLLVRPMRISRRVVVGSPIQRSLAIGMALLLLALLTVGTLFVGAQLLQPRTIIVDPSGNGDTTTVTEGIAMAGDGDTVLMRPGEYVEDVVIDKRITLRGDLGGGSAIIRWTSASPRVGQNLIEPRRRYLSSAGRIGGGEGLDIPHPRGLLVLADGSVLEDLVIAGPGSGLALRVSAGGVTIDSVEVDFDDERVDPTGGHHAMAVHADGGDLTVVNSSIQGDLGVGGPGSVVLRGNTIAGEIGIRDADAVLEDNTVRAGPLAGSGVTVRGDSEVTLAQNDIQVRGRGIFLDGAGVRGTVASNVVTGSQAGLYLEEGVVVTAEGNRFVDNDMGIRSLSASTSFLVNNTVEDNGAGIVLSAGSTEVRENRIIDNRNQGIGVLGDASPVITDNELCGNGTDLFVAETATADTSGNEICPIEGTQSLPARTIIVDPSGNGDAATVNEGITLAAAGDIVLLRPGEYVEDVVVDKAITLRGDGSGQAVIRFTLDSPFTDTLLGFEVDRFLGPARRGEGGATDAPQSRGILIQADGSVLEDLAIAGPGSGLALRVRADGVTISGLETTFESDFGDELAEFRRQVMAVFADGGDITIVDSALQGDLLLGGPGEVTLRGNTIAGEVGIRDAEAVLEDNTIRVGLMGGSGVTVRGDTDATLMQNDIQTDDRAIFLDGVGVQATITNNVLAASTTGLYLDEGATATAEQNTFANNDIGIRSTSAGTSSLRDNTIEGNGAGVILSAGSTEVRDNRVIGNRNQGIGVLGDASPVVADNELCGNGTDLFVAETASADTSGNEICPGTE